MPVSTVSASHPSAGYFPATITRPSQPTGPSQQAQYQQQLDPASLRAQQQALWLQASNQMSAKREQERRQHILQAQAIQQQQHMSMQGHLATTPSVIPSAPVAQLTATSTSAPLSQSTVATPSVTLASSAAKLRSLSIKTTSSTTPLLPAATTVLSPVEERQPAQIQGTRLTPVLTVVPQITPQVNNTQIPGDTKDVSNIIPSAPPLADNDSSKRLAMSTSGTMPTAPPSTGADSFDHQATSASPTAIGPSTTASSNAAPGPLSDLEKTLVTWKGLIESRKAVHDDDPDKAKDLREKLHELDKTIIDRRIAFTNVLNRGLILDDKLEAYQLLGPDAEKATLEAQEQQRCILEDAYKLFLDIRVMDMERHQKHLKLDSMLGVSTARPVLNAPTIPEGTHALSSPTFPKTMLCFVRDLDPSYDPEFLGKFTTKSSPKPSPEIAPPQSPTSSTSQAQLLIPSSIPLEPATVTHSTPAVASVTPQTSAASPPPPIAEPNHDLLSNESVSSADDRSPADTKMRVLALAAFTARSSQPPETTPDIAEDGTGKPTLQQEPTPVSTTKLSQPMETTAVTAEDETRMPTLQQEPTAMTSTAVEDGTEKPSLKRESTPGFIQEVAPGSTSAHSNPDKGGVPDTSSDVLAMNVEPLPAVEEAPIVANTESVDSPNMPPRSKRRRLISEEDEDEEDEDQLVRRRRVIPDVQPGNKKHSVESVAQQQTLELPSSVPSPTVNSNAVVPGADKTQGSGTASDVATATPTSMQPEITAVTAVKPMNVARKKKFPAYQEPLHWHSRSDSGHAPASPTAQNGNALESARSQALETSSTTDTPYRFKRQPGHFYLECVLIPRKRRQIDQEAVAVQEHVPPSSSRTLPLDSSVRTTPSSNPHATSPFKPSAHPPATGKLPPATPRPVKRTAAQSSKQLDEFFIRKSSSISSSNKLLSSTSPSSSSLSSSTVMAASKHQSATSSRVPPSMPESPTSVSSQAKGLLTPLPQTNTPLKPSTTRTPTQQGSSTSTQKYGSRLEDGSSANMIDVGRRLQSPDEARRDAMASKQRRISTVPAATSSGSATQTTPKANPSSLSSPSASSNASSKPQATPPTVQLIKAEVDFSTVARDRIPPSNLDATAAHGARPRARSPSRHGSTLRRRSRSRSRSRSRARGIAETEASTGGTGATTNNTAQNKAPSATVATPSPLRPPASLRPLQNDRRSISPGTTDSTMATGRAVRAPTVSSTSTTSVTATTPTTTSTPTTGVVATSVGEKDPGSTNRIHTYSRQPVPAPPSLTVVPSKSTPAAIQPVSSSSSSPQLDQRRNRPQNQTQQSPKPAASTAAPARERQGDSRESSQAGTERLRHPSSTPSTAATTTETALVRISASPASRPPSKPQPQPQLPLPVRGTVGRRNEGGGDGAERGGGGGKSGASGGSGVLSSSEASLRALLQNVEAHGEVQKKTLLADEERRQKSAVEESSKARSEQALQELGTMAQLQAAYNLPAKKKKGKTKNANHHGADQHMSIVQGWYDDKPSSSSSSSVVSKSAMPASGALAITTTSASSSSSIGGWPESLSPTDSWGTSRNRDHGWGADWDRGKGGSGSGGSGRDHSSNWDHRGRDYDRERRWHLERDRDLGRGGGGRGGPREGGGGWGSRPPPRGSYPSDRSRHPVPPPPPRRRD